MIKVQSSEFENPLPLHCVRSNCKQKSYTGSEDIIHIDLLKTGSISLTCAGNETHLQGPHLIITGFGIPVIFTGQANTELFEIAIGSALYNDIRGLMNGAGKYPLLESSRTNKRPLRILRLDIDTAAEMENIFSDMLREQSNKNFGYTTILKTKCCQLLVFIQRIIHQRTSPSFPTEETDLQDGVWSISDVIRYIQENYADHFTLGSMAAKCALNPSYFSRAFRETAGTPLFEYINMIRINKACRLLKRTDMPIIEIAYSVGYNSVSFFNRYFKKIMQTSPSCYRKINKM